MKISIETMITLVDRVNILISMIIVEVVQHNKKFA